MIRKLLIATAIIASVGITACSDMTAPKKLVPGDLPAATILALHSVAAADREGNPKAVTVVATIYGRGTSVMTARGPREGRPYSIRMLRWSNPGAALLMVPIIASEGVEGIRVSRH